MVEITAQIKRRRKEEIVDEVFIKKNSVGGDQGISSLRKQTGLGATAHISMLNILAFGLLFIASGSALGYQGFPVGLLGGMEKRGPLVGRYYIVTDPGKGEGLVDRSSGRGRSGSGRGFIRVEPVKIRNHIVPGYRVKAVSSEPMPVISERIWVEEGTVLLKVVELAAEVAEICYFFVSETHHQN